MDGEDVLHRHIAKQATAIICCGGVTKHRWHNGDDMLRWHVTSRGVGDKQRRVESPNEGKEAMATMSRITKQ